MLVLIPARTNSSRAPNKNWRPFYQSKCLVDIKIEQLRNAGIPAEMIYVSCEDQEKERHAIPYCVRFMLRDPYLTTKEGERGLLLALVKQMCSVWESSPREIMQDMMLVSVTDPFFSEFDKLIQTWERVRANHDSLMVVRPLTEQVLFGDGQPANFDYFGQPTQFLKGWYAISMCALITKPETILRRKHFIGERPYMFTARQTAVDIDTEDDFTVAQAIYAARQERG